MSWWSWIWGGAMPSFRDLHGREITESTARYPAEPAEPVSDDERTVLRNAARRVAAAKGGRSSQPESSQFSRQRENLPEPEDEPLRGRVVVQSVERVSEEEFETQTGQKDARRPPMRQAYTVPLPADLAAGLESLEASIALLTEQATGFLDAVAMVREQMAALRERAHVDAERTARVEAAMKLLRGE